MPTQQLLNKKSCAEHKLNKPRKPSETSNKTVAAKAPQVQDTIPY